MTAYTNYWNYFKKNRVKDFLISFSDNFKKKTQNPFLGTYLIVWIIRN